MASCNSPHPYTFPLPTFSSKFCSNGWCLISYSPSPMGCCMGSSRAHAERRHGSPSLLHSNTNGWHTADSHTGYASARTGTAGAGAGAGSPGGGGTAGAGFVPPEAPTKTVAQFKDDYELLNTVGQGSSSKCYRCRHRQYEFCLPQPPSVRVLCDSTWIKILLFLSYSSEPTSCLQSRCWTSASWLLKALSWYRSCCVKLESCAPWSTTPLSSCTMCMR